MNSIKLYKLRSKLLSSTVQAHAVDLNYKEDAEGFFKQHKLIQGIYDEISFPVLFKQKYGKKLTDVLDTGWPSLYLISDKMKGVLEKNNLKGWKSFSIKLVDKKDSEIKGYHGLSIIGRSGPIYYNKSQVIEKRLIETGPLTSYYKGLHVDLDNWDDCDFFLPAKNFAIIVTEKVPEIINKNELTNIIFKNLEEIETDTYTAHDVDG